MKNKIFFEGSVRKVPAEADQPVVRDGGPRSVAGSDQAGTLPVHGGPRQEQVQEEGEGAVEELREGQLRAGPRRQAACPRPQKKTRRRSGRWLL